MSEQSNYIDVYIDLLPNQPKNDHTREKFRQFLRQRFEGVLTESVERIWDLPPIVVMPSGEYLALLLEARDLYLFGHFYSCVAMCGIVGERLVKDLFRASILVQKSGTPQIPSNIAFDQLEHVELSSIVRFIKETNLISTKAAKASENLVKLRNKYAHARGRDSQPDALKAIKLLHNLVEDTVSVFSGSNKG